MTINDAPVWVITGCSSGIGRELVTILLSQGQRVVATARQVEKIQDLAEAGAATYPLDVTSSLERLKVISNQIIGIYGGVDYLINNAGYSMMGTVEETSPEETFDIFNTNVFGVLNTTRAFLPHFRERRDGTIVMISSIGAWSAPLGITLYSATKSAVSAIGEGLKQELEHLGINVITIEPGMFRTEVLRVGTNLKRPPQALPDYNTITRLIEDAYLPLHGKQNGDPRACALRIIEIASKTGMAAQRELPARIPLGTDTIEPIQANLSKTAETLEQWNDVIRSTDFFEKI